MPEVLRPARGTKLRDGGAATPTRMPGWLRRPVPRGPQVERVRRTIAHHSLCTVCESAACPNRLECYSSGRFTFMILGDICTRGCAYCKVAVGRPLPVDQGEPERVAGAARDLNLNYAVVTSVCRDDLPDGGATQFARTIQALRDWNDHIMVEVLIPDFRGSLSELQIVQNAHPTVLNHNLETVPRLYRQLRPQGRYEWAIELLDRAKSISPDTPTKSGLMLGLGERDDEIVAVLEDLRRVRCDVVTLGQYVRPSLDHYPVQRYLTPDEFSWFEAVGKDMGFSQVAAGPLVRSSFAAAAVYESVHVSRNVCHEAESGRLSCEDRRCQ